MRKYLPRLGWEKFECTADGDLIDPSNSDAMDQAFMFRWAFVVGWGHHVWWALAQPKDQMARFKKEDR